MKFVDCIITIGVSSFDKKTYDESIRRMESKVFEAAKLTKYYANYHTGEAIKYETIKKRMQRIAKSHAARLTKYQQDFLSRLGAVFVS